MSMNNHSNETLSGTAVKLSAEQVRMIEEALDAVGEFGEVRLVVEKARLRFVVTQKSIDALKWAQQRALSR